MNWLTALFEGKDESSAPDAKTQFEAGLFLTLAKPSPSDHVLDFGSGEGALAIALAAAGQTNVAAIEHSEYSLSRGRQIARRRGLNVSFFKADQRRCPFPDESFDAVAMLGGSFTHPNDFRPEMAVLKEALRLLRPCGVFLLGVTDGNWRRQHFKRDEVEILADGFIYKRTELSPDQSRLVTHELVAEQERGLSTERVTVERLYDTRQVADLLDRVGFGDVSVCRRGFDRPENLPEPNGTAPRFYVSGRAPIPRRELAPRLTLAGSRSAVSLPARRLRGLC